MVICGLSMDYLWVIFGLSMVHDDMLSSGQEGAMKGAFGVPHIPVRSIPYERGTVWSYLEFNSE